MEARVLSYGDVLLRRCDTELLEGPSWLNDQVRRAGGAAKALRCLRSELHARSCHAPRAKSFAPLTLPAPPTRPDHQLLV